MHNYQVIGYAPRQLKTHEENQPTHDLKLVVIIFALTVWRHYLYGVHFKMSNDHKSLKYLFDQKELNMCQRRCMKYLKYYEFKLKYRIKKANIMSDALCRKKMHIAEMMMLEQDLLERLWNLHLQFTWNQEGYLISNLNITRDMREIIRQVQFMDSNNSSATSSSKSSSSLDSPSF